MPTGIPRCEVRVVGASSSPGRALDDVAGLTRANRYLDEAPHADSEAVSVGPFTLFISHTPWAYCARPHRNGRPIRYRDFARLQRACARWRQPFQLEWIHELYPTLEEMVGDLGLKVSSHPLLVITPEMLGGRRRSVYARVLEPEDPQLLQGRAVMHVAFDQRLAMPAGIAEREVRCTQLDADEIRHVHERVRSRRTVTGIVSQEGAGAVTVGSYNPVGDTAEIVGVGTLPAYRRRGLGSDIVHLLCEDAFAKGVQLVLLTAEDEQVARIYRRLGFRQIGTSMTAEEQDLTIAQG
ncbi:GNAT family N-acetyltransferase [Ferrimicrobium sp.]|uniref:GNAT family N-acetyltransferase n=1 Tax=Ferrimicrobium sp. TaxID=2926050 RepID=UPI00262B46E3|nr:GNAT family N-acetyltransferase [Ferrimicrobium sp.]